jgi:hypothetical protein
VFELRIVQQERDKELGADVIIVKLENGLSFKGVIEKTNGVYSYRRIGERDRRWLSATVAKQQMP